MKTLEQIIKEEAFGQGKDGMYPPLSTCIVRVGPNRMAKLVEEYDHKVKVNMDHLEQELSDYQFNELL